MLVDTNLLVYATFADAPEHDRARAAGSRSASPKAREPSRSAGRSSTRCSASSRARGCSAARGHGQGGWAVATAYLEQPAVRLVTAGAGHIEIAGELAHTPGLRSDDIPDIEIRSARDRARGSSSPRTTTASAAFQAYGDRPAHGRRDVASALERTDLDEAVSGRGRLLGSCPRYWIYVKTPANAGFCFLTPTLPTLGPAMDFERPTVRSRRSSLTAASERISCRTGAPMGEGSRSRRVTPAVAASG